ncbi:MAG: type II secretion system protein [Chloroflexi bacterium]|nr:type II secretion system protein [Chloroflexota bacterium]
MRLNRTQKGFTLIELLIVIGILAALAAVAIPTYARFFGQGEVEANQTELSNIQAAMDAMLAQNGLKFVAVLDAPGTNDFSAQPTGADEFEPEFLYPTFLRFGNADNPTKCFYSWNDIGKLTQESCP